MKNINIVGPILLGATLLLPGCNSMHKNPGTIDFKNIQQYFANRTEALLFNNQKGRYTLNNQNQWKKLHNLPTYNEDPINAVQVDMDQYYYDLVDPNNDSDTKPPIQSWGASSCIILTLHGSTKDGRIIRYLSHISADTNAIDALFKFKQRFKKENMEAQIEILQAGIYSGVYKKAPRIALFIDLDALKQHDIPLKERELSTEGAIMLDTHGIPHHYRENKSYNQTFTGYPLKLIDEDETKHLCARRVLCD